ncbi:MAG: hypothetical protein HC837_08170 [Chloroflexaceae bacterium]|nr:hypothetical protein [Chloroflexaceae bacterium]
MAWGNGVLYVVDTYTSRIRQIDPETGKVQTLAGSDAGWLNGPDPLFYEPGGLSFANNRLSIADTNNHAIRVLDLSTRMTSTLMLRGLPAGFPRQQHMQAVVRRLPTHLPWVQRAAPQGR